MTAAKPPISVLAALALSLLGLNACSQVSRAAGTFADLTSLAAQVQSHFLESTVAAKLVDCRDLTIQIAGSKRSRASDAEKSKTALDIARYAYSHFETRGRLAKVVVSFTRRDSMFGFVTGDSDPAGVFEFQGDDLARWYREQTV